MERFVVPDEFIRIEFRCIGRQQVHMQSGVFHQEVTDTFGPMW